MEVAACGCAGGPAQRYGLPAADDLAHLDGERGQVVVRGFETVAVIDDHPVPAAVRMPSNEGHLAAGRGMDRGSALRHVVLAAVEFADGARDRANAISEGRGGNELIQGASENTSGSGGRDAAC